MLPLCSRCAPGTPGALAAAQASLSAHRSTSCSFRWWVMPFIFRGWIKIEGHIEPHVWQFWALNKHYPFFWGNRVTNLTNTHTKAYNIHIYIYISILFLEYPIWYKKFICLPRPVLLQETINHQIHGSLFSLHICWGAFTTHAGNLGLLPRLCNMEPFYGKFNIAMGNHDFQ